MSPDDYPVTSDAELRAALRILLKRANANGVTVEGGWDCRTDDGDPDWDVIVTEVEKPTG